MVQVSTQTTASWEEGRGPGLLDASARACKRRRKAVVCEFILTKGPRRGRKCGRLNCINHARQTDGDVEDASARDDAGDCDGEHGGAGGGAGDAGDASARSGAGDAEQGDLGASSDSTAESDGAGHGASAGDGARDAAGDARNGASDGEQDETSPKPSSESDGAGE